MATEAQGVCSVVRFQFGSCISIINGSRHFFTLFRIRIRLMPHGSSSDRTSRPPGFTLIELLVVISIIALLISIMMPALSRSRHAARNVIDQTRLRQLQTACVSYAGDHAGWFPWRTSSGAYMPHQIKDGGYDLNASFARKYLTTQLDPAVFCIGELYTVRNPVAFPSYPGQYYAFTYANYPAGGWVVPKPKLHRDDADGRYAMWTCLTTLKDTGRFLGHDSPEIPVKPTGQHAAKADGSVAWSPWSHLEVFVITSGHTFYWPRP